ncbi:2-oxoglutarate dehydrogenase E2 component [Singulisphaera sp. GP187]|uniref:2-oxoglutarate dehydrogenase complex dihydrolipoyllysine-residue succinyltransferase n=1 Tax=Singulisphaera sp. GP187 TaxID=1882752 RepID=UPI0009262EBC|nr:2-oxoglutarate dehydrogenase complex dihydrolipoyllysine-residue succinyltransferase [Singulisphaera sp. GP187]SIO13669.1 2-oxoglutarate dehydrogenase E2 component [Singulisphaera sp. GP187]
MPAVAITVPGVGESISEGILSRWLKADGSAVKAGEPLFELETDKANNVVPASASGVLKINVAEGETVDIGATVGTIDPEGQPSAAAAVAAPKPPADSKSAVAPPKAATAPATANGGAAVTLSPAVRRIVAEENVDPNQVDGTGRGGRITKGDVLAHVAATPGEPAAPSGAPAAAPAALTNGPATTSGLPRETRKRMSGIRQKIAQRLVEAQQTAAILTTFNEADMSRVMDLRARYKDTFKTKHGVALGFMSFFLKAAVEALKAFPAVNGRIDGNEIVLHNAYDIGVAVSTERGLMVPVIRDADRLTFAGIEKAIGAYAVKAREGTMAVSDLQGGTFTITNGGVFGSLLSTPILNPPQSGILGMHSIQKRPVAIDDQVVIRPMMYLALSYDHRIVDGREAVSFLVRIKECIENPERLMLEI